MDETAADLAGLQRLLDESASRAGPHLRSVFAPALRLSAAEACERLTGIRIWTVATVGAAGRPLAAPLDGVLHRGRLHVATAPTAVRARQLAVRPAASATYLEGERLAVVVHGDAVRLDLADAGCRPLRDRLVALYAPRYGADWEAWAVGQAWFRLEPRRMFASRLPGGNEAGGPAEAAR